jgi:5-methylcytosine-specific restriction endonuclease McrA
MDSYIKTFLNVIRNCNVDNTYKMAWSKAIVELCLHNPNLTSIKLEDLAIKVFKYYWDQTIYFDLVQGSNLIKPPMFISEVKKHINSYYIEVGDKQPRQYERISNRIHPNISKLVSILKSDVSYRFLNLDGQIIPLYQYTKGNDVLFIDNAAVIAEYSDCIFEAINFRWTQILENFNVAPRIAKKVRILDFPEIKRKNLSKFKVFLSNENPTHECFICLEEINDSNISIDHVIPWSFIFNDDLWNLVYTHKNCNSSKSNIIPSESIIHKLEKRNMKLLENLKSSNIINSKKHIEELEIAINSNTIRKFWINCKQ